MTIQSILRQYKYNESINAHSENLLLLANHFGTEEEQREALRQAESKRDVDARDYQMPRYLAESINAYYYKHLTTQPL